MRRLANVQAFSLYKKYFTMKQLELDKITW